MFPVATSVLHNLIIQAFHHVLLEFFLVYWLSMVSLLTTIDQKFNVYFSRWFCRFQTHIAVSIVHFFLFNADALRLHFYLVFSFPFLLSISHNMPKSLMNFDWIILLGIEGCQPKSVSMVGVCYQWNWFCCSKVLSRFSKLFSKYSHLFYQNSTYDKVVCSFITDWICIFITCSLDGITASVNHSQECGK